MKEDVLEQIVDDYLKVRGYFTVHNVSFRPRSTDPDYEAEKDRVPSDVDVIGSTRASREANESTWSVASHGKQGSTRTTGFGFSEKKRGSAGASPGNSFASFGSASGPRRFARKSPT